MPPPQKKARYFVLYTTISSVDSVSAERCRVTIGGGVLEQGDLAKQHAQCRS
jgi:hypothetical protein